MGVGNMIAGKNMRDGGKTWGWEGIRVGKCGGGKWKKGVGMGQGWRRNGEWRDIKKKIPVGWQSNWKKIVNWCTHFWVGRETSMNSNVYWNTWGLVERLRYEIMRKYRGTQNEFVRLKLMKFENWETKNLGDKYTGQCLSTYSNKINIFEANLKPGNRNHGSLCGPPLGVALAWITGQPQRGASGGRAGRRVTRGAVSI